MNNVSLLFYIADVIENIKPVATFMAIFFFILGGAPFVASLCGETQRVTTYHRRDPKTYEKTEITYSEWKNLPWGEKFDNWEEIFIRFWPKAKMWGWLTVPLAVFMIVFANALPSRETIFMIATSEFVEDFSKTETGTEIGALAKETLDYLKGELAKLKEAE